MCLKDPLFLQDRQTLGSLGEQEKHLELHSKHCPLFKTNPILQVRHSPDELQVGQVQGRQLSDKGSS